MTRRSFVKVVATAVAPLSGCGLLNPEAPIRVGASIWPGYECLFIARSLQLFGNQAVKLVEYPSTPEVIRAFKNHAIELAALSADDILRLAAEEPDIRAVLVMDFSVGADALVGRTEHKGVNDLRGKKIGVEVNTLGVYMLTRALAGASLTPKDVEVISVDNDQHISAFVSGRVDAVVTFEPHRSKILKQGGRSLFDSAHIPGEIADYLVVREPVLQKRSSAVRAIISGWFKARERLLNEGEEMARLVAARESTTPAEFLESLELLEIPSPEHNRQLLAENGRSFVSLRQAHQFLAQHGLFDGAAPRPELFDGGYLP